MIVTHDASSESEAIIVSVAVGGVAVGATAAVALNKLEAVSFIGTDPLAKEQTTGRGELTAKTLTVTADAVADTEAIGVGVAGGAIAVNASSHPGTICLIMVTWLCDQPRCSTAYAGHPDR